MVSFHTQPFKLVANFIPEPNKNQITVSIISDCLTLATFFTIQQNQTEHSWRINSIITEMCKI